MAFYTPDYKLIEAEKVIKALDPNNERDELILYYIEKKNEWIKTQSEWLEKHRKFFEMLDSFLPNHNPTLG